MFVYFEVQKKGQKSSNKTIQNFIDFVIKNKNNIVFKDLYEFEDETTCLVNIDNLSKELLSANEVKQLVSELNSKKVGLCCPHTGIYYFNVKHPYTYRGTECVGRNYEVPLLNCFNDEFVFSEVSKCKDENGTETAIDLFLQYLEKK